MDTTTKATWPNPGSRRAVDAGCTCAVIDNGYGRGYGGDGEKFGWAITVDCPLHGEAVTKEEDR